MNQTSHVFKTLRPITHLAWSLIPAGLLISLVAGWVVRLQSLTVASAITDQLYQADVSEGWSAIGDELAQRSDPSEVARWRTITRISSAAAGPWSRVASRTGMEATFPQPGRAWELEPLAEPLLVRSEAAIELIEAADPATFPVWSPAVYVNGDTDISEVYDRSLVSRMLLRRFDIAVHRGEPEEAMRMLGLNGKLAASLDTRALATTEIFRQGVLEVAHERIGYTLSFDFWSPEQISQLRSMVNSEVPTAEHFLQTFLNEQLFRFGELQSRSQPFNGPQLDRVLDSAVLKARYWQNVRQHIETLSMNQRGGLPTPARFPPQAFAGDSFLSLPTTGDQGQWSPDNRSKFLQRNIQRFKTSIAITDAALAVKQHWMTRGERPLAIEDLRDVGFEPERLIAPISPGRNRSSLVRYDASSDDRVYIRQIFKPDLDTLVPIRENSTEGRNIVVTRPTQNKDR